MVVWERRPEGIARLVVLAERAVVLETSPGDLRAMGAAPEWTTVARLVTAEWLDELEARPARPFRGEPATRRRGRAGEVEVDLLWLERLALPAELELRRAGRGERLRLERVHGIDEAPWQPPPVRGLRSIDAADLGDGAGDSELAALLALP